MLGDKIIVKPHHTRAAQGAYERIRGRVLDNPGPSVITVAGESGSGKSEIASEIARLFQEDNNLKGIIFHQDDYFVYPPKTNNEVRRKDIKNVGMNEVKMDLLDSDLLKAKQAEAQNLEKPLIDYNNNEILSESVDIENLQIIIAEGTYTTALENADIRVFINRTYEDTLEHRKERARDKLDEYVEEILKIEHEIISSQKKEADIIIDRDYNIEG
ncbi:uridine kinase [Elusimicrobiota bacterium]